MSQPNIDQLANILRPSALREMNVLMGEMRPSDLTSCELVTILTALRAAAERKRTVDTPPVQLSVVRPQRRRKKGSGPGHA